MLPCEPVGAALDTQIYLAILLTVGTLLLMVRLVVTILPADTFPVYVGKYVATLALAYT